MAFTTSQLSWDIIGLDSNNLQVGPDTFLVGARVCSSQACTGCSATIIFQGAKNPYVNLLPGSPSTLPVTGAGSISLSAGQCTDFYYNVQITRVSAAYGSVQHYQIFASCYQGSTHSWVVTTPPGRQLLVERLISQNRNGVTTFSGPTNVVAG